MKINICFYLKTLLFNKYNYILNTDFYFSIILLFTHYKILLINKKIFPFYNIIKLFLTFYFSNNKFK
jgi:hypothetical protein